MADDKNSKCPNHGEDVLCIGPELGEGISAYSRHRPDCTVEVGFGRAGAENDKNVWLVSPREDGNFDVIGEKAPNGPAKYNSKAYKEGWARIFGGESNIGSA